MNGVAVPWIAEVVLLSWRSAKRNKRPPLPSELLATFVVFGTISLANGPIQRPATAFGWGVVVATFLNFAGTEDKLIAPKWGGTTITKGNRG